MRYKSSSRKSRVPDLVIRTKWVDRETMERLYPPPASPITNRIMDAEWDGRVRVKWGGR